MEKNELITNRNYHYVADDNDEQIKNLREEFVQTYCYLKGWDVEKLTPEQLYEIKKQNGYKNPNMIKS